MTLGYHGACGSEPAFRNFSRSPGGKRFVHNFSVLFWGGRGNKGEIGGRKETDI